MKKKSFFTIKDKTDTRGIYRITLIAFVAVSLAGALPYMLSGVLPNFFDALFESVSGFTTTGVSCIASEAHAPTWIIIYRAFTQWIGGALILVFLASVLRNFDYDSNTDDQRAQLYRTGIRFRNIVIRLLSTYAAMSAAIFIALLVIKTDPLIALVYALSVVSTGGRGIGDWFNYSMDNNMQTVLLIFMVLSCINYTIYYHIIKKHFNRIIKSSEFYAYLFILVIGSVLVVASLIAGGFDIKDAVHNGIFETVSHATTTGIDIVDTSKWPAFSKIILTLLTYTGGCTASPGSGIKVLRIIILGKLIARSFIYRIHPNAIVAIKMNGKPVSAAVQKSVISYFLVLSAFFIAGCFMISFEAGSLEETLHITSYLINNTGGGVLTAYSGFMKLMMCILMLAGRLEFYALLIPFTKEN